MKRLIGIIGMMLICGSPVSAQQEGGGELFWYSDLLLRFEANLRYDKEQQGTSKAGIYERNKWIREVRACRDLPCHIKTTNHLYSIIPTLYHSVNRHRSYEERMRGKGEEEHIAIWQGIIKSKNYNDLLMVLLEIVERMNNQVMCDRWHAYARRQFERIAAAHMGDTTR